MSSQTGANKASSGKLALLYDGQCELCRVSVDALRGFDASGQLEMLDLHDSTVRARFLGLDLDDLMEELHAVDDHGRIYRGARAINEILRRQPGIRGWLAYAWYLPGFPWLAERQYKRIAQNRYQPHPGGHGKRSAPGQARNAER